VRPRDESQRRAAASAWVIPPMTNTNATARAHTQHGQRCLQHVYSHARVRTSWLSVIPAARSRTTVPRAEGALAVASPRLALSSAGAVARHDLAVLVDGVLKDRAQHVVQTLELAALPPVVRRRLHQPHAERRVPRVRVGNVKGLPVLRLGHDQSHQLAQLGEHGLACTPREFTTRPSISRLHE
jgi:hypothetical protein